MSPAWFEDYVRFISMIQIQFDRINQEKMIISVCTVATNNSDTS